MTRPDTLRSTLVAWLKILLPLIALAILSTLFLVSRRIDPEAAIPYADVDLADRLGSPRLTAPTWTGVTADGAAMTVRAAEARPGGEGREAPSATAVAARLETPDGGRTELVADRGVIDAATDSLTVEGSVVVTTSAGFRLATDRLTAALDRTALASPGPVRGTAPFGRIEAGAMRIAEDAARPGRYLLVFRDRVKLVYLPPS